MADLQTIAENLRTQDNRITEHPIFMVQGLRRINGHNLSHFRDVRIYVEGAWRNEEWQFVRALLMKDDSNG